MSGRPYTMLELKGIVDYIVERRLYSEYKGRKMWQDYAGSCLTTRTWQSLKETFLKRIVPDIHNPVYKLNLDQIRSIRFGYDIKTRGNEGKLEFRSASSIQKPSKHLSKPNGEDTQGEPQTSHIVIKRESTDTIVLGTDKCVEILEILDSDEEQLAKESVEREPSTSPSKKSIRDCITYSEPLTPMLQEILHDFDSEEEEEDVKNVFDTELEIIEHGIDVEPDEMETQLPIVETYKEPVQEENSSKENINTENSSEEIQKNKKTKKATKKTAKKATRNAVSENEIDVNAQNSSEEFEKYNIKKSSKKTLTSTKKAKSDGEGPKDATDTRITRSNLLAQISEMGSTSQAKDTPAPITTNNIELDKCTNNSIVATAGTTQQSMPDCLLPNNQEGLSGDTNKRQTSLSTDQDKSETKTHRKSTETSQIIEAKGKQKDTSDTDSKKNKTKSQEKQNDTEEWNSHNYNDKDYDPKQKNQKDNNDVDIQISKGDTVKSKKGSETTKNKQPENKSNKVDPPKTINVESSQRKKSPRPDKKENQTSSKHATDVKKTSWSIRENQTEGLKLILEKQLGSSPSILESQYSESEVETPILNQNQKESSSSLSDKEETSKSNMKNQPKPSKSENEVRTLTTDAGNKTNKPGLNLEKAGTSKADENQRLPLQSREDDGIVSETTNTTCGTINASKPVPDPDVILSDSTTEESERPKKRNMAVIVNGLFSNRKDGVSRKRGRGRRYDKDGSSSWTSDSDDDIFDTIPSRRRRNSKYAKSKRILIDEDGNAFFAVGRRLEALKKQPADNTSEDFWKQKFLEEQNRNADLIKLLTKISETNNFVRNEPERPAIQQPETSTSKLLNNINETNNLVRNEPERPALQQPETSTSKPKEAPPENDAKKLDNAGLPKPDHSSPKGIIVEFGESQKIRLHGEWPDLRRIFPELIVLIEKSQHMQETGKPETKGNLSDTKAIKRDTIVNQPDTKVNQLETKVNQPNTKVNQPDTKVNQPDTKVNQSDTKNNLCKVKKNGVEEQKAEMNTISDDESDKESAITISHSDDEKEIHEKINMLEEEILIDTLQKEASPTSSRFSTDSLQTFTSSVDVNRRPKRVPKKINRDIPQQPVVQGPAPKRLRGNVNDGDVSVSRRKKKTDEVSSDANTGKKKVANKKTTASKKSSPKKSNNATLDVIEEKESEDNESEVIRYKFPSPVQEKKKNSPIIKQKKQKVAEKTTELQLNFIPEQSMESTQGYLDTDCSSFTVINLRRKKKLTLATKPHRGRQSRNFKRKSCNTYAEDTTESSNSCFNIPTIKINERPRRRSSSVNSSRYKTDSYQLIMAQRKEIHRLSSERSNAIIMNRELNLSPASQNLEGSIASKNSSSISLPASPELSIVGNISIESNCLRRVFEHPSLNETQEMEHSNVMDTAYLSKVDASLPLMRQDRNLTINRETINSILENTAITMKDLQDSKADETCPTNTTDIQNNLGNTEGTVNESLHIKLSNMLLESAKKMSRKPLENEKENNSPIVKEKIKKRSSTPRKKRASIKLLTPADAIVEEHMECCSSGRKSAPPKLFTDEIRIQENSITLPENSFNERPKRIRKTKEVIKVKISRPKRSSSRLSIMTDSGINDNSTLYDDNASVDLIHNHSETCIAKDCMSDSCEIIDKTMSIISITSNSNQSDNQASSPIFFSAYSLDGSMKHDALLSKSTLSPRFQPMVSPNSLITEDLSDQDTNIARPDWYFYSEDDTNTNLMLLKPPDCTMGSSLNQIFPIVCAVPDLSTITEHTEANDENSKKGFCSFSANSDSKTY